MKVNIKIFLITLIMYSINNDISSNDSEPQLNPYFENNNKVKPIDYLTIKILSDKEQANLKSVEAPSFTASQLLSRFVEKTECNKIKSIAGQSIDNIIQEISKINDNDLTKNNIDNFSRGALYFIANGVLTYGEITPDKAMEKYNEKAQKYNESNKDNPLPILKEEEVTEARQKDIDEIERREDLQDLAELCIKIKEISNNNINNMDPSTAEVMKIFEVFLSKYQDNKLRNELVDLLMRRDRSEDIIIAPLTKEELEELKKIITENHILPKDEGMLAKIRFIGKKIKDLLKTIGSKNNKNIEKNNQNTNEEKVTEQNNKEQNKSKNNEVSEANTENKSEQKEDEKSNIENKNDQTKQTSIPTNKEDIKVNDKEEISGEPAKEKQDSINKADTTKVSDSEADKPKVSATDTAKASDSDNTAQPIDENLIQLVDILNAMQQN